MDDNNNNYDIGEINALNRMLSSDAQVASLRAEISRRNANTARMRAEMETIKQEHVEKRAKIKAEAEQLGQQYSKEKGKILKAEQEVAELSKKTGKFKTSALLFEPFLKRFNIDLEKGTCAEGKEIHQTEEGKCNGWDCPKANVKF